MSAVRKLQPKPQPKILDAKIFRRQDLDAKIFRAKIFHAKMLVTRAEEWWVEAETAEEAQALLASGQGHHSALGERVHVELEELLED